MLNVIAVSPEQFAEIVRKAPWTAVHSMLGIAAENIFLRDKDVLILSSNSGHVAELPADAEASVESTVKEAWKWKQRQVEGVDGIPRF